MPIKPGMLMRLRLNRGLERTQIPVELISYNPLSLFCFQMYNNISIKIFDYSIKTKKCPNVFDLGIWLKEVWSGSWLGNLGFALYVNVGWKEKAVGFDFISSEFSCMFTPCLYRESYSTKLLLLSALWDEVVEFMM